MSATYTQVAQKIDQITTIRKKLVDFGDDEKYMRMSPKNDQHDDSRYEFSRKNKPKPKTLGGDIFTSWIKFGVGMGILALTNWVSDKKNIKDVENILKFGKGLFDFMSNVIGFGANNLMDGLSKLLGDSSIWNKLLGGLQAALGFFSLKWLLNPLSIIKDFKAIPKLVKTLHKTIKFLSGSLDDLARWAKTGVTGIAKDIGKAFSRSILKIFGRDIWRYLRGVTKGIGSTIGKGVGGAIGSAGKFIGKLIPSGAIRTFAKFLTKIPIVGSILGIGVNLLLGDSPQKAGFKAVTGGVGAFLGGLVGAFFPPALPFTTVLGGLLGDYLGDTLFDFFIPPKLATGGVVEHTTAEGTHVIVAEKEDEVVIPLSMLTLDGLYGSKYFEPLKIIGSNILGLIKNVINTNNGVFSNVSAEINATVVELSKTFGIAPIISSKKTSSGYTERGIMRNNEVKSSGLTKYDNTVKIIGDENLSTVTKNSETTNTTVRGLLHAILGVVKPESITKGANSMNMITATAPPAIHQTVETGGFIASGRATYYHPGDGGDPWGDMTSTGERYSYTEFTAAALPGLINKLPPELTVPVKGRDRHYKQSRTVQKPFVVRVVHPKTGKQAYIRINNVGQGGKDNRVIDFSSAPAKYFGGDVSEVQVYLAPQNATPGIINAPKYSSGGEYKFNSAPHKRWGGKRIRRKHAGEDFDMRDDGTFQSWIGGTVMYKGFQPGRNLYGHYIDIYNENLKVVERIAEAGKFKVQVGDKITPGQIVSTGTSTGMIHYEIRPMDTYERKYGFGGTVDPVKYLNSIGAANIAGNMIKNNSLASLVNGTVIANDIKQSPVNSQTSNTDQSSVVPVMSGAALANAFTQITQMLGVEPTEPPPKTENGLSLLFDGTKNNVVNIAHSMVNQNLYSNTRLRML